jgi:hypothetical protein
MILLADSPNPSILYFPPFYHLLVIHWRRGGVPAAIPCACGGRAQNENCPFASLTQFLCYARLNKVNFVRRSKQKIPLTRDNFRFGGEREVASGDPLDGGPAKSMNVLSLRSQPFSFFRLAQASLARLQNKNARYRGTFIDYAEREGFEPPEAFTSTVFKTAAFDRSAISPAQK